MKNSASAREWRIAMINAINNNNYNTSCLALCMAKPTLVSSGTSARLENSRESEREVRGTEIDTNCNLRFMRTLKIKTAAVFFLSFFLVFFFFHYYYYYYYYYY